MYRCALRCPELKSLASTALAQGVVTTVAQRRALGVFASAEIQGAGLLCGIAHWQKVSALVGTVAKRLAIAFAARAPKVFASFFDIDGHWGLLWNFRSGHKFLSLLWVPV